MDSECLFFLRSRVYLVLTKSQNNVYFLEKTTVVEYIVSGYFVANYVLLYFDPREPQGTGRVRVRRTRTGTNNVRKDCEKGMCKLNSIQLYLEVDISFF